VSCRKCTTWKNICIHLKAGFPQIKEVAHQYYYCSSLLFCFRELSRFLDISVRDPQKIIQVSRNLKLNPRNSILDPRKSKLEPHNSSLKTRYSILENFEDQESSFEWVYSSHESSSSRESSSSHKSGSSQVPIFFVFFFLFFDYTNDVGAVTRNINFLVVDIYFFHSRSKESLPLRIAVASPWYTTTVNINTFSKNSKAYNLHMAEEHVPYSWYTGKTTVKGVEARNI